MVVYSFYYFRIICNVNIFIGKNIICILFEAEGDSVLLILGDLGGGVIGVVLGVVGDLGWVLFVFIWIFCL